MKSILILNTTAVNEGKIFQTDILVRKGRIEQIAKDLSSLPADIVIDAKGKYLFPGIIDDQVHFREPGLTSKACISTESKAAVAGGVTSFMEMPNTVPHVLTQRLLEEKYDIAAKNALANYSFYMGVSNDNISEALKTDPQNICGLKIFMGSSTGNMLVDNPQTLENIFKETPMLVATHCEDEQTILGNTEIYYKKYGKNMPIDYHAEIRNVGACLLSSSTAVDLAQKHGTRLHVLHISTKEEINLFDNTILLQEKKITSEVCVHHLWFNRSDYKRLGTQIKCNPAIKEKHHQQALFQALLADKLDVIATDHAPHTYQEKQNNYWQAPSGIPLIQHALNMMLEFYCHKKISLEKIVEKMCHAPAHCFQVAERGFLREGYWADLILVDTGNMYEVNKKNIFYRCGWSPLEGRCFHSKVTHTIVSGHLAYYEGYFDESAKGQRLQFNKRQ